MSDALRFPMMFQAAIYLLLLSCAVKYCFWRCASKLRLAASCTCIGVTWFYIFRFMVYYDGDNAFDAAYADMIWGGSSGNWGITQMLLTWAVVAMVWSHEAPCAFQFFGAFGAMSASFLVYDPPQRPSAGVPLSYFLSALAGFWCTWMLPTTLSSDSLRWWLWGFQAALLVPKFLPWGGRRLDPIAVHIVLAAMCFFTHVFSTSSPWPKTDCQFSISIDLVVCSVVTLAYIREGLKTPVVAMPMVAVLVPLASPGCALALAAAIRHGLPRIATTLAQRIIANRLLTLSRTLRQPPAWMNLGYWNSAVPESERDDASTNGHSPLSYASACQALAGLVGKAADLKADQKLLCVGCGSGEELHYFRKAHKLSLVVGLDPTEGATSPGQQNDDAVRRVQGLAEEVGSRQKTGFKRGDFDKIVAVDSIYHCNKARVFLESTKLLEFGGIVAVSDVIVRESAPLWFRLALVGMNIPWSNHWSEAQYCARLEQVGLKLRGLESLEPHVLAHWFPAAMRRHCDFVVVTAQVIRPMKRPTAAIVGSGMSGCLAGWRLSETHDVTVFEAGPVINLAGQSAVVDEAIVDVPLRMIAPHYYTHMMQAIEALEVPTKPARCDFCVFEAARTLLVTHMSGLKTCWERMQYVGTLFRLTWSMTFHPPPDSKMTFRAWMLRHGLTESPVYTTFALPHLSWTLSCDTAMVEGYPATAVLGCIRSMNPLLSFAKGHVQPRWLQLPPDQPGQLDRQARHC